MHHEKMTGPLRPSEETYPSTAKNYEASNLPTPESTDMQTEGSPLRFPLLEGEEPGEAYREELLARVASAEHAQERDDALAELLSTFVPMLKSFLGRRERSFAEAEDIIQESLFSTWRVFSRSDRAITTDNLAAYLVAVAKNQSITNFRKRRVRPTEVPFFEHDSDSSATESGKVVAFIARDDLEDVYARDALEGIFARFRQKNPDMVALLQMLQYGFTYRECAERLNIPVGTAKRRVFQLGQALRAELTNRDGVISPLRLQAHTNNYLPNRIPIAWCALNWLDGFLLLKHAANRIIPRSKI